VISSGKWPWVLFVVAAAMYVVGIGWGLPEGVQGRSLPWGTDELGPVGAVNEVYGLLFANKPNFNPQYPMWHYFCQLVAVAPYYATLWLGGHISYPAAVFPYGLDNPATQLKVMTVLARLVSVLMGAGIVVTALRTGETLRDRRMAMLAAIFVMLQYTMFYYARTSNVDVGALFWTTLALLVLASCLTQGVTQRRWMAFGILSALAVSAKDASYGACLAAGIVILILHIRARRRAGQSWLETLRIPAYAVAVSLIVYAIASGLVFRPTRYVNHIKFITAGSAGGTGQFYFRYPATPMGYLNVGRELLQQLNDAMGLPMLVCSLAGVAAWIVRDRKMLLWIAPAIGFILVVIAPVRFVQLRFVMIIAYVLAFAAADLLSRAADAANSLPRLAARGAVVVVVLWSLVRAGDVTYQMLHDSRYEASEWLGTRLQPGDRVGHFVPGFNLPYLPAGVTAEIQRGQRLIDLPSGTGPEFLISMPQRDIEPVHERALPEELYQKLVAGTGGYRQVALIQGPTLFERRPQTYLNAPVRIFAREDVWQSRLSGR
jgi:hypothetical protein